MKVKVIKRYRDKELKKILEVNHEFEVTNERGAVLIGAGVAEEVVVEQVQEEQKQEPVNEEPKQEPKKTTRGRGKSAKTAKAK